MRRLLVLAVLLAGCGELTPAAAPTPSGTLFLSGREPGVLIRVDAASGTVSTRTGVRQMGGGDPPYMLHYTGGRLVTFALGRSSSFAPDLTHPKSLGESWFFVPSATPGRIWNLLLRGGDKATQVNFRGVREVAVDGRVTFARRWAVPGWAMGAVSDGLVLQRRRLEVWDPRTGTRVRRLPGTFPVAFRGDVVASCGDPCKRLYLNDRRVRGDFAIPYQGAFSPDGRWLVLQASRQRLSLVDVQRGTSTLLPGARTDKEYPAVAWASSGWLFWSAGDGDLGAWRPGERTRLLGVKVERFIDMTSD